MPKIIKNGVSYTKDTATIAAELVNGSSTISQSGGVLNADTSGIASTLTSGSTTIGQASGHLESTSAYVRGDASTGAITSGVFKIYSGTTDPSSSLGQNGDIYLKRVSS